MSDSEDFGITDDETAFVAVATQIEAQAEDFEQSSRPSKRRRLAVREEAESDYDVDEEGYYLPGELSGREEPEKQVKSARYKTHDSNAEQLPIQFVTQTQIGLDDDPAAIRGPIWKKPAQVSMMEPPPVRIQCDDRNEMPPPLRPAASNTLNGFVQRSTKVLPPKVPKQRVSSVMSRNQENIDISIDLTDFPSDAFSSQDEPDMAKKPHTKLRAPHTGLKQMTIFGQPATQDLTASQAATKRHAWPAKDRVEKDTHHLLDDDALRKWIYPTNLGTIRDYQFNIVSRSLYHNTLVALPTGLGKTFIAATVMLNYYRWTKSAQIIFMAPTKPLIAQQMEACYSIVGLPRSDTVLMTGETAPAIRAEEWLERRVFFMTPQTVINDLKTGICDPKKIVLVVVDEAHKATGGYAYTEVVSFLRRFNQSFRVMALTATPGSTVEAVQAVIDNLGIARVELRTEASLDIRQYTHEKHTDTQLFDYSEEQVLIMGHVSKAIQPILDKLNSQNAYWVKDPMSLTPFGLTTARGKWAQSDAGRKAPMPIKGMVNSIFTTLASLAHGLNMLKFHGIGPFFATMREFQKNVEEGKSKGKYPRQIMESEGFTRAMGLMRAWSNNIDFIGHPKMEYLREVIMNHFLDAGEGQKNRSTPVRPTRVMIFSSFRDSTEEICRVLKRSEPLIRPHVFVGQSASKTSEGMDQKKQNAVIQDFKNGKYNTLVATSIGEEGLDIGDVDLIICYDASSSPIRMLQRIGRTGRKRVGKVQLLLMRQKEDADYKKAQDNYAYIQKTIADESKYSYRDDESPRIIPKVVQPVVDKRIVDIPVENSQPIDLNERARRKKGKAKKPAKKFHMPDGVRTGFVKASRLDASDDDEEEDEPAPKKKRTSAAVARKKKVVAAPLPPEAAVPFLEDVLLTAGQNRDFERRYAMTKADDKDDTVYAPDPGSQPSLLRTDTTVEYVRHGWHANLVTQTMQTINRVDDTAIERWKSVRQLLPIELQLAQRARLVEAPAPRTVTKSVSAMIDDETDLDDELDEYFKQEASKTARSKPKKAAKPRKSAAGRSNAATKKPAKRAAGKRNASRADDYGSDAMEGSDSEPEATPTDMRLATQGVDLGSQDTSGEDEEDEEPDTELEDFIAASSDPIEFMTSSLPTSQLMAASTPKSKKRLQKRKPAPVIFSSDDETLDGDEIEAPASGEDNDMTEAVKSRGIQRGKRVVSDDDSDEQ